MKKPNSFCSVVAVITMMIAIIMPSSNASATDDNLVCYRPSIVSDTTRFKLNIKRHSPLSEKKEERKFGHAKQTAFSVHGKTVGGCGGFTIQPTDGTVITGKPTKNTTGQIGAHMGFEGHATRAFDSCRSFTLECTTTEVSATPKTWNCFARNEFDVFFDAFTLTKIDETKDPLCSIFEDGFPDGLTPTVPEPEEGGPGFGTAAGGPTTGGPTPPVEEPPADEPPPQEPPPQEPTP